MLQVAPSILSADFANLAQDCTPLLSKDNRMLHFDVMDGLFVPNISVGLPVLRSLKAALPDAIYDVHLMIQRPLEYVEEFAKAGADYITFHVEAESPIEETLEAIHHTGAKAGISLRPGTPVDALFPYLDAVDLILVMSVEPGFGGQAFMPEAPRRIAALRKEAERQGTALLLEVDGGINADTAPLCARAGVDILVAGNAVFKADDPAKMIQMLRNA